MSDRLTKDQIEDLVEYCGSTPTRWRGSNMQICCPIHSEKHPSMGVSEEKQVVHCFSCGFAGSFAWFLFHARSEEFKNFHSAQKFLKDRYELEYRELYDDRLRLKRYEDFQTEENNARNVLPIYKLAPYHCGKKTYEYFFRRGFDKEDMVKYKIGYDEESRTVVIPVFWEDNTLAGMIGRYIDKRRKNERYKIYHFQRGEILFPLNFFEAENDTCILVEGQFDAMRLHKLGYKNTLAKMGAELTEKQIDLLSERCNTIIYFADNDERGLEAGEKDREKLKGMFNFKVVDYPEHGKDACEWSEEEIREMIENAHSFNFKRIMRI